MSEHPLYDELAYKWYELYEDSEGPLVIPFADAVESLPNRYGDLPTAQVGTCGLVDCGTKRHKPKFKLFGRNQGTRGTV